MLLRLVRYRAFCGIVLMLFIVPTANAEWSAIAGQKTSYTTDALQFSSTLRLRLSEDPSQPTVVAIKKADDVIWQPSLEVIRTSSNLFGTNVLSFKAHGVIYTNNPIFNHGDYRLQNRQWLDAVTSVLLRYRYVPNLSLGPNFESRTGSRWIREEQVSSHHWRAEFERVLSDSLTATLIGRYGLRLYNAAFAERDTQFFTVGPRLVWQATNSLSVTLAYLYERGIANGHERVQSRDDVSYYLHLASVEAKIRLTDHLDLGLAYVHRRKSFTSGLVGDTNLGRFDQTHQGTAELQCHITPAATVLMSFQRGQRISTNSLRDFNNTVISVGGQYHF